MTKPNFEDAQRIARGCLDYGGGYRGDNRELEIYHHGIQTVINSLEAAAKSGLGDTQVAALHRMGAGEQAVASKPNNPQAFPGPDLGEASVNIHEGMTLRDYFAAKAMAAGIVFDGGMPPGETKQDQRMNHAKRAYRMADAMLEASQQAEEPTSKSDRPSTSLIYVVCNNDHMRSATCCEEAAKAEVKRLASKDPDPRCYYHYHEVRML